MPNNDAYHGINNLYLSIVSPEEAAAEDIDDPVMSDWIASCLPDQATILDAGCGLGYHLVALHRGLPAKQTGKQFHVFGSDYSESMLSSAKINGTKAGIRADAYKQSSFADLRQIDEWADHFDAVLINYAIYTYPETVTDYDAYFLDCIRGVDRVLGHSGHLLFNLRDWPSFVSEGDVDHDYANAHDGIEYRCRYSWRFGKHRHHLAHVTMESCQNGLERKTIIRFAERTPQELVAMLKEQFGYQLVDIQSHGSGTMNFSTVIMRKM